MKKWLPRILGPLGFIVFVVAIYVLQNELKNYTYQDILNTFRSIPQIKILLAAALALAYYLVLGGYDVIAFKYIGVPLKFKDILFTCFISNALGNNTGYSMLFGGSIRYRMYSLYNVSMLNVTKVLFFSSATIWLGLLTIGGIVFTFTPVNFESAKFMFASTRPVGFIFLIILFTYIALSFSAKPRKFFKWEINFPNAQIVMWQTILAALDWVLASLVLYALLPAGAIPYFTLLKIFLVAQLLGILSQVPGGMGVFESAIFLLMPSASGRPDVMGALIAYRLIFYFFPLSIALILLASHEFLRMRKKFQTASKIFGGRMTSILPQALTFTMFLAGVIILFANFTPIEINQLKSIIALIPMWLLNTLHFVAAASAVGLLLIARGLQLRIKRAYSWGVFLLIVSIIAAVLTEQPVLKIAGLIILLATLLPAKTYFYRNIGILATRLNTWWGLAISGVFVMSVWLGFFVYSQDISSWRSVKLFTEALFENTDSARFLRAALGMLLILFIVILEQLFRAFFMRRRTLTPEKISEIITKSERTYPHIALSGDKQFIGSPDGETFLMYASSGLSAIALGDPVGAQQNNTELLWQFKEMCDAAALRPSFIGTSGRQLHIYYDIGLEVIKLGDNAEVPLARFTGGAFKDITARVEAEGFSFEVIPPENFETYKNVYAKINETWLKKAGYVEMNFLPGAYKDYMKMYSFGVVKKDARVVAFAPIVLSALNNEASIAALRHDFSCENIVEYLTYNCVMHAKNAGVRWFDLGYCLSAEDAKENAQLKRFARLFPMSEHFDYDIARLREFKSKFNPVWQYKYIAVNTSKFNFLFLRNLAGLILPNESAQRRWFKWMRGKILKN
jgi:phosphatidylglycerol lysyltransferase